MDRDVCHAGPFIALARFARELGDARLMAPDIKTLASYRLVLSNPLPPLPSAR